MSSHLQLDPQAPGARRASPGFPRPRARTLDDREAGVQRGAIASSLSLTPSIPEDLPNVDARYASARARDPDCAHLRGLLRRPPAVRQTRDRPIHALRPRPGSCLLYTSDAADDLLCVD